MVFRGGPLVRTILMASPVMRPVLGWLLLTAPLLASLAVADRASAQPVPFSLKDEGEEVQIVADRLRQIGGVPDLLIAEGNVEIRRGTSRLFADRVELNRDTGQAVAQGKVVFYDGEDRLVGDRLDYNLKTGTGVVYNGRAFSAPYYRISGEQMERIGERTYRIQRGVFTTCEGDEPDWSFKAGSATADLDASLFGRDASFWVRNVPVIPWIPFFSAALRRERQSGFLFPTLGVSSRKGAFARIPYYWAIDDSQDLTVSLDTYTNLGVGGSLEYRYILSERVLGAASGFYIKEVLADGDDRGFGSFKHDWQITPRLAFKIDANLTSDDDVFRDYGDRLHDRSLQRVESNIFLTQRWDAWNLVANVLWYQDLTTTSPVELQRVPEIRLQGLQQPVPGLPALLYELETSFTNFVREVGSEGVRADLHPRFFLPVPVAGLFTVTPFLGGRLTYYNKRVVGHRLTPGGITIEETVDDDRVRRQVEAGLDAEARASRVYMVGGKGGISALQHAVEPRVRYLEIRGVDQKDLPQWDPAIDNIGRVSEITYSITNRLNAKTVAGPNQEPVRWEMVQFVLSQTYNLLPSADQPFGDLRADLIVQPNQNFRFRGDVAYSVHGLGLREANTDLSANYRDVAVTVGTRFNEEAGIEFAQAAVGARLTRWLNGRVSAYVDTRKAILLESRIGVDIHFQCWGIMLEYVNRHQDENEVRFSVNLLGLGQLGSLAGRDAGPAAGVAVRAEALEETPVRTRARRGPR